MLWVLKIIVLLLTVLLLKQKRYRHKSCRQFNLQGDSVVISVDNNMPQRLTYFWQNNLGNTASITDFPDTSHGMLLE